MYHKLKITSLAFDVRSKPIASRLWGIFYFYQSPLQNIQRPTQSQQQIVVICDEEVYRIAKEIQLIRSIEFKDIVLTMRSFHVTKILFGRIDIISPVVVKECVKAARKRARQVASVLTSIENINKQKEKEKATEKKKSKTKSQNETKRKQKQTTPADDESDTLSESEMILQDEDSTEENWDENNCAGCGENYSATQKTDDWWQCIRCDKW
ncbi:hypothetical protein FQR65_LT04015 [Abscondita terminalis]|nr:hypothetical protein FQR65_LT04015 [Abscondita terminalis]